jgi:hypothetical protein
MPRKKKYDSSPPLETERPISRLALCLLWASKRAPTVGVRRHLERFAHEGEFSDGRPVPRPLTPEVRQILKRFEEKARNGRPTPRHRKKGPDHDPPRHPPAP